MSAKLKPKQAFYTSFDEIDGEHPLQSEVEDFCVLYNVRTRPGGRVAYLNFDLAQEMGLLPLKHPHKMNGELEEKLLETFGIIIINEYDLQKRNKESFLQKSSIRFKKFMATRYLQLQHPTKKGKTSGDGRSIWNGFFKGRKGVTWDVSSCGTGATRLSPATAINNKFFRTGDPSVSYGCGHADILDGLGAGMMSEIFHRNGIETERVLCIIEYSGKRSVNVRVGKNLVRPSHLFRYLKQGRHKGLREITNYYIDRQVENGGWLDIKGEKKRYDYLLKKVTETFATISAIFEAEYIFCWLEWDGDNILMDGGIIDYGSVRQFGLYHYEYRYDDVERMSTNLVEQKGKSKYMVKTFAQMVDFLKTGNKKNLKEFDRHSCLSEFDEIFFKTKSDLVLKKVGFRKEQRDYLLKSCKKLTANFFQAHYYFESIKSVKGPREIEDGITHNAVFCMRDLLRVYPGILCQRRKYGEILEFGEFLQSFVSSYACDDDLKEVPYKIKKAKEWQLSYQKMISKVANKFDIPFFDLCFDIKVEAQRNNRYDRITGDSVVHVAKEFIQHKEKVSFDRFTCLVEEFIKTQTISSVRIVEKKSSSRKRFLDKIKGIIVDYREGI